MSPEEASDLARLRHRVEQLENLVSEYEQASEALGATTARTQGILDAAIDGIVTIDETGTIESVNPAVGQLFGYRPSDLIGRNVKVLMPAPFEAEHDGYLARYRRTRQRRIIGVGREVEGRRRDGTVFPIDLSISEGHDGSRRFFTGILRDISERREADAALRASEERLRAILDSAVDGILSIDETGQIVSLNPSASTLFGYSADELVGENVRMLMPSPYHEEHDGYLARYRETGEKRIIGRGREVTGRRKDGSEFPLALAVSEGRAGERRLFTGIVRDLSEREALRAVEKRAVEAEKLASIATLTAGIAHDVGTPMNVILGYANMLERSLEDEKQRDRARIIGEQTKRVTELIQTLLDISRPRAPRRSDLALSAVLDHALEFCQEKLRKRGITVERDYRDVPPVVGDRDQLEQVFLNLIVNAADAMGEGGTLFVTLAPAGDEAVEIRVRDTGAGIDPEALSRIFDPFFTTKEPGHGNGLGLHVSRSTVADHGGTIIAESTLGQGTEFRIELPLQPPD